MAAASAQPSSSTINPTKTRKTFTTSVGTFFYLLNVEKEELFKDTAQQQLDHQDKGRVCH